MAFPMDDTDGGTVDDKGISNGQPIVAHSEDDNSSTMSGSFRGSPCSLGSAEKPKDTRKSSVSELVAKSKKAASSLWTLLHAKVRR